jgi:hypothetical protein
MLHTMARKYSIQLTPKNAERYVKGEEDQVIKTLTEKLRRRSHARAVPRS